MKKFIVIFLFFFLSITPAFSYVVGSPPAMLNQNWAQYAVDPAADDQGAASTTNVTLKNVIDAVGTGEIAVIVFPHNGAANTTTYTLSTAETVPSNFYLDIQPGAVIQPAAGISLTAYSPANIIAAPNQQIVDTTNNSTNPLLFTEGGIVHSAWFGLPDGTNDEVEPNCAVTSLGSNSGVIELLGLDYDIDTNPITLSSRIILKGVWASYSGNGTTLTCNISDNCIEIGDGTTVITDVGIKNIAIAAGSATDGTGLALQYAWNCWVEKVKITGFETGTGLKIAGSTVLGTGASIQNRLDTLYLANNLTNLLLTGTAGAGVSSADENVFISTRINTSALASSKGIYFQKAQGNVFERVTIIDTSPPAGNIGILFDDDAAGGLTYSSNGNEIRSLWMEHQETPIQFEATTAMNIIGNFHSHNPTYEVVDNSGGGNIVRYASHGWNASFSAMTYVSQTYNNLIQNNDFERWEASTSAAPTGWALSGAAATIARDSDNERSGSYSAAVTRAGADADFTYTMPTGSWEHLKGRWVTFAAWVKTSTASQVQLRIADNVGGTSGKYHSGGGSYELLTVRRKMDASATGIVFYVRVRTTDGTAYVDSCIGLEGVEATLPMPNFLQDSKRLYASTTWDPGNLVDGAGETKSLTVNGAALGDFVIVSAPYDLQDCIATGYVQAANTVEIRLQNESTGAIDFASGTWRVMVFKY